ncbi:hypothetical protein C2E23DRAFT_854065 [Lenzites betulinus]|nr:hypothetical protein C2E23DRAFT_854065 [Lenzites betulinus]
MSRPPCHSPIRFSQRCCSAHIDLELPGIVVIGNQSAGKSSLVEAISGISVPRDAGTCIRCPMECRLASGPAKSRSATKTTDRESGSFTGLFSSSRIHITLRIPTAPSPLDTHKATAATAVGDEHGDAKLRTYMMAELYRVLQGWLRGGYER